MARGASLTAAPVVVTAVLILLIQVSSTYASLVGASIPPLSSSDFHAVVSNSPADQVVIAKFYAPWCSHCRAFEPIYTKFAASHLRASKAAVVRVDCDGAGKQACTQQKITSYPTIRMFRGGSGHFLSDFKRAPTSTVANLEYWFKHYSSPGRAASSSRPSKRRAKTTAAPAAPAAPEAGAKHRANHVLPTYSVIYEGGINIRLTPSSSGKVVGHLKEGATFKATGMTSGGQWISVGSNRWVTSVHGTVPLVKLVQQPQQPQPQQRQRTQPATLKPEKYKVVYEGGVNVRNAPASSASPASTVVRHLNYGDVVYGRLLPAKAPGGPREWIRLADR
eukprot:g6215.t1